MTCLQGFVEVYRGPERSYKVTKLQPGIRYTSRVQVRGLRRCLKPCSASSAVHREPTAVHHDCCLANGQNHLCCAAAGPQQAGGGALQPVQLLHYTGDRTLAARAANLPDSVLGKEVTSRVYMRVVPQAHVTILVLAGEGVERLCVGTCRRTPSLGSHHAAMPPSYAPQTALTLAWTAPADNGSPIVCYTLERDDGAGGDFMHVYAGPNTSHTIKGLRPGLQYRFRLRADNDVSPGAGVALVPWLSSRAPRHTPLLVAWTAQKHTSQLKACASEQCK